MKIIEALKELPLIKKKMEKNIQDIKKYSSYITGVNLEFETEEKQKDVVKSLVQSNKDLATRFEKLTNNLSDTNSSVVVEIEGVRKTIREWISFKNVTANYLKATQDALSIFSAQQALSINQGKLNLEQGLQVKKTYKEEDKLTELNRLQNLLDKIDATLEIINVNTDLKE